MKKTAKKDQLLQKLMCDEARRIHAQLEQRVERRTAELRAAESEMDTFAYSISHDLRAPLIHIGGFVDLLLEHTGPRLDEEGRHYLQRIAESTYKMGRMIDEVLALSRMSRAEMHLMPLELKGIVKEVMNDVRSLTEGRRIIWVLGELPQVTADPNLLRTILFHLVSNAVKFTRPREEARIELGARQENGETVCFVRDNGIGFDMKHRDKLFGVFQRLHASAEFEGPGVGLAQVHRAVQRHGGRTWAEAAPDEGATFYFSLPDHPPADP
ncbi:MAG: sensor histidine kinase [Opitutaceae bacterium]